MLVRRMRRIMAVVSANCAENKDSAHPFNGKSTRYVLGVRMLGIDWLAWGFRLDIT